MWRREDGKNINYNGESGESQLIYLDFHKQSRDDDIWSLTPDRIVTTFIILPRDVLIDNI